MGVEAARAAIALEDALGVTLHLGAGEHGTRLRFDEAEQRGVLELLVALEIDAIDGRVLDDVDDEGTARGGDANVGEQTGGEQRLQRRVDIGGAIRFARLDGEVGADGLLLDALVAVHNNPAGGCGVSSGGPGAPGGVRPDRRQNQDRDRKRRPLRNFRQDSHEARAPSCCFGIPHGAAGVRIPSPEHRAFTAFSGRCKRTKWLIWYFLGHSCPGATSPASDRRPIMTRAAGCRSR